MTVYVRLPAADPRVNRSPRVAARSIKTSLPGAQAGLGRTQSSRHGSFSNRCLEYGKTYASLPGTKRWHIHLNPGV